MGRPLLGLNLHSASCLCQTCVPSPPPQPVASTSTTQQPSGSSTRSFAERLHELHSQALRTEATVLRSLTDVQQSRIRASTAIEAAYERLVQLRLRLRQSLDTMSSGPEDSETPHASMGPGYSALVLPVNPLAPQSTPEASGSLSFADIVSSSHDTDPTPTSQGQPLFSQTIRRRFTELADRLEELDNSLSGTRPSLHRTSSPPRHTTDASGALPRTSRLRNSLSHSSDASTSLGRRVEARASAARSTSDDNTRPDVNEFMTAADTSLALLARQQQQLLASSRSFRQDPPSAGGAVSPPTADSPSIPVDSSARRWFARDRTAVWRPNMRERRPRDPEGNNGIVISFRPSQGDGPREPTTSFSSLSLIPRNRRGNATEMPELEDETDDPANRRSYRIRRRLNPDGPSTIPIQGIDTPTFDSAEQRDRYINGRQSRWAALSPARIWPDTPAREEEPPRNGADAAPEEEPRLRAYYLWPNRTDRRLPPHLSSRRRRGWARLDADGNEIPTDEEDEYERSRTHMRARAQALTSRQPNRNPVALSGSAEASTLPPAPPSPSWGWTYSDPEYMPPMPPLVDINSSERITSPIFRVRRGSQESLSSDASTSTVTANFEPPEPDTPVVSVPPFQPSPLPWAPLDFSSSHHTQQKEPALPTKVQFSMNSPFAGR